jgi:hypothetical protein
MKLVYKNTPEFPPNLNNYSRREETSGVRCRARKVLVFCGATNLIVHMDDHAKEEALRKSSKSTGEY